LIEYQLEQISNQFSDDKSQKIIYESNLLKKKKAKYEVFKKGNSFPQAKK
jgi:hypothetical protein